MIRKSALCSILLFFMLASFAIGSDSVLVLHAYHQGFEWTDHITAGIESVFKPFRKDIDLHYEYLDTLHNSDNTYFERLAALYQAKMRHNHYDVIILSDDGALGFLRKFGPSLYPGVPVVFCGVRNYAPAMRTDWPQMTGVAARLDHQATLNLMLQLHPRCRKILILIDKSSIGLEIESGLEATLPLFENRVAFEMLQDFSLDDLPGKLRSLGPDDLIYLAVLNRDRDNRLISNAQAMRLLMRWSPAPIYSSRDCYFAKGIVGGMITSARQQGEQAAHLALRILSGQRAQDIPVTIKSPNLYMFDYRQLARFNIKLNRLPRERVMINQPPGVLQSNIKAVFGLALVIALCALLLLFYQFYQGRRQSVLVQLNMEMDRRIREKNAELTVIHQKLKKQSSTDGLTGLSNRRYVYQRYLEEVKKAQRYEYPLSIILFDIDHLKQVNDVYGHVIGDKVLRDVAQAFKRNLREIDLVGRFGSEEFLLVLPNSDKAAGLSTAERMGQNVLELRWESGQLQVTVSGGLAELKSSNAAELLKKVEERLERAKSGGRNQIVASDDPAA